MNRPQDVMEVGDEFATRINNRVIGAYFCKHNQRQGHKLIYTCHKIINNAFLAQSARASDFYDSNLKAASSTLAVGFFSLPTSEFFESCSSTRRSHDINTLNASIPLPAKLDACDN